MKLYYSELSNYCSKVKFLIDYKNLKIDLISPPGGYGSSDFKKINPLGTIPFLEHKELSIFESEIINEYLNEIYPNPSMLTTQKKTNIKIKLLSRYHDQNLEPSIRYFFKFKKNFDFNNEMLDNGFNLLQKKLDVLEKLIDNTKYIATNDITLADCAFPSFLALLNIFTKIFNSKVILGAKTSKYFSNIINDSFMYNQYNRYYQTVEKWSKETFQ